MYTPSQKILSRYADVLVNFALNNGKGVKKGETIYLIISEDARPLMVELRKTIAKAGAHLILRYTPSDEGRFNFSKDFYTLAAPHQLSYTPEKYFTGIVEEVDHVIGILSNDPKQLEGIDPGKLSIHGNALTKFRVLYSAKQSQGKLSWTLAQYGTEALAKEAGLTLKEYWGEIIKACYLDTKNPIKQWKDTFKKIESVKKKLDALPIDTLHIEGEDINLLISFGEKRKWLGGGGSNIPTFEIFCSPDWRGTEGWIRFNQPVYYLGNKISGVELWFEEGKVVQCSAKQGEKLLKSMIASENADKIGEFSLTDSRFSRITKFMANTLYDENIGGPEGNTHIALGKAYKEGYAGDPKKLKDSDWKNLGFNTSSVHTDIFSTSPRTVTAYLKNKKSKVIYTKGKFTV